MIKIRKHGGLLLVGALVSALCMSSCGEDLATIQPSSIGSLELGVKSYQLAGPMPEQLASVEGLGTLMATPSGLVRLGTETTESILEESVVAMTELQSSILVATPSELFVWAGTLESTYLDSQLEGATFYDVKAAGDELWFATSVGLFRADEENIESFSELTDVRSVRTYSGSSAVVLEREEVGVYLLELQGNDWVGQSLTEEGIDYALAHAGSTILGVKGGQLVMRQPAESTEVVWQPVSITEEDEGTLIGAMIADPSTGAAWIESDYGLRRMLGDAVHTVSAPTAGAALVDVSGEGSVWLVDGETLYRLSPPDEGTGFEEHILPFHQNNCARCHSGGSDARPLDTYEQWVNDIDLIIAVVGNGSMPADGQPLVGGTVELLEAWKLGGLER